MTLKIRQHHTGLYFYSVHKGDFPLCVSAPDFLDEVEALEAAHEYLSGLSA